MSRDEYITELHSLIDSFDDQVSGADVVRTLRVIADQIEQEGLHEFECDVCGSNGHGSLGHGSFQMDSSE